MEQEDDAKKKDEPVLCEHAGKLNKERLYANYWHCRDFELTNLWQRSIFLAAFLLMIYTAYGALLREIANSLDITSYDNKYQFLNLCGVGLSILGMIFSVLWIMMSKGSKAWYEKYEKAIAAMENDLAFKEKDVAGTFECGELKDYVAPKVNSSLISTKGGCYSPSKINIAIGQISFVIWIILMIVHSLILINLSSCYCNHWTCVLAIIFILLFLVFIKDALFSDWLKSSSIKENR